MRENSILDRVRCKRCFQYVRRQYLKGGLCPGCRKEIEHAIRKKKEQELWKEIHRVLGKKR